MNIVHTYHPKFSGGIGDFLRGSIYLHRICKEKGMTLYIDWSKHPIGQYISGSQNIPEYDLKYVLDVEKITLKSIKNFGSNRPAYKRYRDTTHHIIDSMMVSTDTQDVVPISSFYLDIDYETNTLQSVKDYIISEDCAIFLQNSIRISEDVKKASTQVVNNNKNYATIHFRLGDRHSLPNLVESLNDIPESIKTNYNLQQFNHNYEFMQDIINRFVKNNNYDYVVILSDSNDFKEYVRSHSIDHRILISHLNSNHSASKPGLLKYTKLYSNDFSSEHAASLAIDLDLLINSKHNVSYSVYSWGSGLSIWPSKIFNIPATINEQTLEGLYLNA